MKHFYLLLFVPAMLLISCSKPQQESHKPTKVEVKDNWLYVNGEKFFINGIGYEIGARPGQGPYQKNKRTLDLGRIRHDMKVLKDAGFNTIRTWKELEEEQLKVVQESGLKIVFGIWIAPEEDFSNPEVIRKAEELVKKVVSYSKNYDCIITYLILNEPQVQNMHRNGAKATVDLLTKAKQILNTEHPGIPVTISAAASLADFWDENIFDVYGYNSYFYEEPVRTLEFKNHLKWLATQNKQGKPLIITEFGTSVSDLGWNEYGGNTMVQQTNNLLKQYRGLLDAGATGACPFYYADGWWKGGQDSIHNNTAEEWFGFFGYSDVNDTIGHPRPVWWAMQTYIKGLILSPKNEEIYSNKIPMEFWLGEEVGKIVVYKKDSIIYEKKVEKAGYLSETITVEPKGMEAAELDFQFFDKSGHFLKDETLYVLLTKNQPKLPVLTIEVTPDDLNNSKVAKMKIIIDNESDFKLDNNLRFIFQQYNSWDFGTYDNIYLNEQRDKKHIEFEKSVNINENCWVLHTSAGITARYGKFAIRIFDKKITYRGDWAIGLARE